MKMTNREQRAIVAFVTFSDLGRTNQSSFNSERFSAIVIQGSARAAERVEAMLDG